MTSPEDSMKATAEDRLEPVESGRNGFPVKPVVLVLVVLVGLVLLFYPRGDETPAPVEEDVAATAPEPAPQPLPAAQDIPEPAPEPEPEPEPETGSAEVVPAEPPLPAPEDSDPLVREELASFDLQGELSGLATGEDLVQRGVALVDGASRGVILRKILPMEAPETAFPVREEGEQMFMDPAGYARYEPYVEALEALDTGAMAESFHDLRALYEAAYAQLGLPAEELDNALIRALDRVLATPQINGPIALERESVMYTYADPALEALPGLQKQLLRTGPDNLRRIKAVAASLREQLLEP